jgi:hypothetical protein
MLSLLPFLLFLLLRLRLLRILQSQSWVFHLIRKRELRVPLVVLLDLFSVVVRGALLLALLLVWDFESFLGSKHGLGKSL